MEALSLGAVWMSAMAGHEVLTAICPRCLRDAPKPPSRHRFPYPVRLALPRDRASAVVVLSRAVPTFRDLPDTW